MDWNSSRGRATIVAGEFAVLTLGYYCQTRLIRTAVEAWVRGEEQHAREVLGWVWKSERVLDPFGVNRGDRFVRREGLDARSRPSAGS